MTSGLTLAYLACVRKFSPTSPRARSVRRTSAIFRYVFNTRAEPYSSTNWRFAFSMVFGFKSATVAAMTHLPERMEMQDAGDDPNHADSETNQGGGHEGHYQQPRE